MKELYEVGIIPSWSGQYSIGFRYEVIRTLAQEPKSPRACYCACYEKDRAELIANMLNAFSSEDMPNEDISKKEYMSKVDEIGKLVMKRDRIYEYAREIGKLAPQLERGVGGSGFEIHNLELLVRKLAIELK